MPPGKSRSDGKSSDERTCCPNASGCRDAPFAGDLALRSGRDHLGESSYLGRAFYTPKSTSQQSWPPPIDFPSALGGGQDLLNARGKVRFPRRKVSYPPP